MVRTIVILFVFAGVFTPGYSTAQNFSDAQQLNALGPVEISLIDAGGIAVAEDHQGFMWFGGLNGLARYDGSSFTRYHPDPDDPSSLSALRVEYLYVDNEGTLWVGTFDGGLNKFDPRSESFTHYRHDPDDPNSLSQNSVTVILQDRNGTLWIGTHDGLNQFDPISETFTHYKYSSDDPTSLSNNQVRVLYEDREGTLWVGTGSPSWSETPLGEGGLNRFNRASDSFTRFMHIPGDPTSLIDNQIMALNEDSRGIFYVGTLKDGLHTMDRETGTFTRLRYDPDHPSVLSRPFLEGAIFDEDCISWYCGGVNLIYEDKQGLLWVGGIYGGLNRYDLTVTSSNRIRVNAMNHFETANSGLGDNAVWTIAESQDGTLWLGTWGGMHKVISSAISFPHITTDTRGAVSNYVLALYEDREGTLWVGNNGLNRIDMESGRSTYFGHDPNDERSLGAGDLIDIYQDRAGYLWTGHIEGGISRFDPATEQFTRFEHDPENAFSLSIDNPSSFLEDRQGRFWIGTQGSGIDLFDRNSGTTRHYRHDPEDSSSLSHNMVLSLYEDHKGTLWAGTSSGLNQVSVDQDTISFTTYFPDLTITSMLEDRKQRFWVGTWGNGLHLFDPQTGLSTRYGPEEGLASANVGGLVEDDSGYLWISSAEGTSITYNRHGQLTRFDPDNEDVVNYDMRDGLPDIGFYYDSAIKTQSGLLMFGGEGGMTMIDPANIREPAQQPPRLTLTDLRVFNDVITPGPEQPIQHPIHQANEITLAHTQNDFTIDYAALTFRNPERVQYQYRLEPRDETWISARSQRSARYSGLSPGSYVFRVQGVDSRGSRSAEEASIQVTVLPPWWRTPFMYIMYGLLGLLGVYGLNRLQRHRLVAREQEKTRERELAQAREIEKAHLELQQTHEDLKATQQQLIQQEKMASLGQVTAGIAHEIKNPLNFVTNFSIINKELIDEIEETPDARINELDDIFLSLKENLSRIHTHGQRANHIVQSMMQHASGLQSQQVSVELHHFLDEYVNLTYHSYQAKYPGFDVDIELNFDRNHDSVAIKSRDLGRVLINLFNNAFDAMIEKKEQEDGAYQAQLIVSTKRHDNQVEIRIQDNGIGIPDEFKDKVFEPFFTTKPTGTGTGLGLSLSYDIVTKGHGGSLVVDGQSGEGSAFIISLPVQ